MSFILSEGMPWRMVKGGSPDNPSSPTSVCMSFKNSVNSSFPSPSESTDLKTSSKIRNSGGTDMNWLAARSTSASDKYLLLSMSILSNSRWNSASLLEEKPIDLPSCIVRAVVRPKSRSAIRWHRSWNSWKLRPPPNSSLNSLMTWLASDPSSLEPTIPEPMRPAMSSLESIWPFLSVSSCTNCRRSLGPHRCWRWSRTAASSVRNSSNPRQPFASASASSTRRSTTGSKSGAHCCTPSRSSNRTTS
mmetsp:Transcript_105524/g.298217  ORF Transcript_105524/g.298217 Transcript_105524/m.298217 type:complete len:247 (-) Transcript_105524:717-1457(-)